MTDDKKQAEQQYDINANLAGAFAARTGDENPGLALEVMKTYLNPSDPINALAYATALQEGYAGSILEKRAKQIDAPHYQAALMQRNLGEILGSDLGKGLEGKLKEAVIAKDGPQAYTDYQAKFAEYTLQAKKIQADYAVLIKEAKDAKDEKKAQELSAEAKAKIEELNEKYDAKKLQRVQTVVSEAEKITFATIGGNATIKSEYLPGYSDEEIIKAANAERKKA